MPSRAETVLSELVALKSTSEDDAGPILDYVSNKFRKLGMQPKKYGVPSRPSIVASHRKGGVMFSGHLDTVPHGVDWEYQDGEVVRGRLYGRGSCDMKGGCTATILAAESLVAADVPFSLCFTTDEETTMDGAAAAATKDAAFRSASAIVVAEPTDFDIVFREKGQLQLRLRTEGVAAHSSMPELGENAIAKMMALLSKTEDLQKVPRDSLDKMTMSVTTIKGGTRINVIPSDCEAEIDIRYTAGKTRESVMRLLKGRFGRSGYELAVLHDLEAVETDPGSPAVKTMRSILGPRSRTISVPYATEMVMFKRANDAIFVCGPGNPKGCHIDNENIAIAEVIRAAEVYAEFASRMAPS